ncbi:UPF0115 protein YfcN [Buchnera aphidicola (Neophyllaphis podocarpi)]|uniref:endonuclease SmrB n=1 Tax=Buchnera aphidicola TaxID=9 RepID=UPI0031B89E69
MENNKSTFISDHDLFMLYSRGTRVINQDTIFHISRKNSHKKFLSNKNFFDKDSHSYYFSNNNNDITFTYNPVSYLKDNKYFNIFKKLKQGNYKPDITLDLHGFNQYEAKKELGSLINICIKEKIFCACIMHGHGKNILKKQIPLWLSRHPDIIAFYQAPKNFGHTAALFFLIDF